MWEEQKQPGGEKSRGKVTYLEKHVDQVNKWPLTRTIVSYFIGVGAAFFFWKIFIVNLNFSLETSFKYLIILIVILGPGYAFSVRIRCIVCLIFLGCFGKSGRSYLRGLFFILIISGPVTNLALNTKEVVRVFACATILTFNLTKTRFDLMTSPFRKAVVLMKDDMHQIKESLNEIEAVVDPVRSEIEGKDNEDSLFDQSEDGSFNDTSFDDLDDFDDTSFNRTEDPLLNIFKDHSSTTKDTLLNKTEDTSTLINETDATSFNITKDNLFNATEDNVFNATDDNVFNTTEDNVFKKTEDNVFNVTEDSLFNVTDDTLFNTTEDNVFNTTEDTLFNKTEDNVFNKSKRQSGSKNEDSADFQKTYENKISRRCELQFKKGTNKCKQAFAKMYDSCFDKMPMIVNYLLCWPMKIDLMCHMTSSTKQVCNPKGVIDPDLGKNYKRLKNIEKQFGENTTNVNVSYTIISPKEIPGVISAQETGKRVIDGFNKKMVLVQFFMNILNRILAFIFIKLILNSIKYNKNYLKNIDFDNLYITQYFKKIDARRKDRAHHSLLPLKKFERTLIIDPEDHSVKTKAEKSNFFVHILKFILELTTVMTFLLIDYVFYYMLKTIRKHSVIEFRQRGRHNVNFSINGTGLIAKLLRSSLLGFNQKKEMSVRLTNESCLPNPSKLGLMFYFQFWSICILIIVLIYHEVPLMRTRRLVCSYFYPKREKKRVLHLYNSMLKRRRVILKDMRKEVLKRCQKNKIKQDMNIFIRLRLKFPKKMGWLIRFKIARRKCLICEEHEPVPPKPKKKSSNELSNDDNNSDNSSAVTNTSNLIVECPTEKCNSIHCKECWRDIGEICLACYKMTSNDN